MNLKYIVKKRWSGFRQRYKLRTHIKITSKLFLIFMIVWWIASAMIIFFQWTCTDGMDEPLFQKKYLKYFWAVVIELVSGFDIDPQGFDLNTYSQILSIIVLITGIAIFAIFTGQIVSIFVSVVQKINYIPEKPENLIFNKPIIICGINDKINKIIEELRKNCLSKDREIIIVDYMADSLKIVNKDLYYDVWYVKGNPADRRTLDKVIGKDQTSTIILASENDEKLKNLDSHAIQTAIAIESYRDKVHTVLELREERNIPHLKYTKINEWISIFEYGIRLTAQAALQHGMGKVFVYLLGGEQKKQKTNQIYITQTDLPIQVNGLTYEEVRKKIHSLSNLDITLIGFEKYVTNNNTDISCLKLNNYSYIKQLNPVKRICSICGSNIYDMDEIGRIQKKCSNCLRTGEPQIDYRSNKWFFPIDTPLCPKDKLIYLSDKPISCQEIFDK